MSSHHSLSSEKLQANRENAKHSTGPRTEQGKQRTSQNALKHGLLARQAVLPEEDLHEYDGCIQSLEQQLQPADFIEFSLIRQVVDAEWRLRRLTRIETAIALHAVAEKRRDQARYGKDLADYEDFEDTAREVDQAAFGLGPEPANPETLAALRETELFGDAMSGEGRRLDTYGRYGARLLRQFEGAVSTLTLRQKLRAAQPQQDPVHRRSPQSESEYTPPPPTDPLNPGRWAPDHYPDPRIDDIPVTLEQSLDPLVRSRLRGDPDRLDAKNTKRTQSRLTDTTETAYQQDALDFQAQPMRPNPDRDPPDS